MKHLFKHAAFAAFIGAMAFTACSDDDNNIQIDRDLSGEYKSEMNVTVTEIGADESEKELGTYLVPQQFTVARSADGNEYMDLTIKGIKFDDQSWGDLTLTHLKAGRYADRYTIVSESDQSMSINGLGNCTVSLIGSGNPQAVSAVINVNASGRRIELIVTGTKLNGTESSQGAISTFVFDANYDKANAAVTTQPQIEGQNITFHVAPGADITKLKATVTTTPEETTKLYPASNTAIDYTTPATYIVAAEDGTRIEYTVTAIVDAE